ncbi:unnamed protein product [Microthlaspi erraticum]|uniref:Retrotransposon gag domain-containing protein n=1 Tax=Microthlaspi erraticum TaxID=1685480 RepID=A0A6D2IH18_9BRAS|nr:unnamed protein product [Microthlaspi erraticum]
MEKEPQASSPIKAIPLRHIPPQRNLLERTRDTKKKLLPYLEAADLETSSQAASYREEHLLATPEEEIDPELIEFVKRDQFHDLFSEYALEHIDHFDNLCDSYGVFDFEKKMMLFSTSLAGPALDWAQHEPLSTIESWIDFREAFLKRFARTTFQIQVHTTLISWRESVKKKNGEAYHPILNFADYGLGDNPKKIQLFQLSLAGQAKDWAKFNAQHAFKTWNGYKGAFLTDLLKVLFMSHHHAQAIHNTIHHHQT